MITQAIKRWLQKIAGWFSGRTSEEAVYAPVHSPLNMGVTQDTAARASSEAIMPQPGIAHQIMGQGETSCSTIDEWPERVMQSAPPPNDKAEPLPPSSPATPISVTPPTEATTVTTKENPVSKSKSVFPDAPPPTPTPEQQLEFMHYLVKRGIVNEGFTEGQVPEQYRKH